MVDSKEAEKRAKEAAMEAEISSFFDQKKAAGSGDKLATLAVWLDNPPFKSKNIPLKVSCANIQK